SGPAAAGFFFFQAEDGIRDFHVTGVQTCALPIYRGRGRGRRRAGGRRAGRRARARRGADGRADAGDGRPGGDAAADVVRLGVQEIGRASCRERVERAGGAGAVGKRDGTGGGGRER